MGSPITQTQKGVANFSGNTPLLAMEFTLDVSSLAFLSGVACPALFLPSCPQELVPGVCLLAFFSLPKSLSPGATPLTRSRGMLAYLLSLVYPRCVLTCSSAGGRGPGSCAYLLS